MGIEDFLVYSMVTFKILILMGIIAYIVYRGFKGGSF